eukprot:2152924-Rhodomonas_salina.1
MGHRTVGRRALRMGVIGGWSPLSTPPLGATILRSPPSPPPPPPPPPPSSAEANLPHSGWED